METVVSALIMGLVVVLWDVARMFFQSWWITREMRKESSRQSEQQAEGGFCKNCCPRCKPEQKETSETKAE
jgi:hypothetical protein